MSCLSALVIGAHLVSWHPTSDSMRTVTPGVYVTSCDSWAAGALRNSEGRLSTYAGVSLPLGRFELLAGGVTGYRRARLLPFVVPSYRIGSARVSFVPNPFGPSALHLSYEAELK